ncbi:hypothetical protein DDI_0959 [Dickeya dianthicola RNS04.9]|nr:hypothetical protein DDI_0959 [Dickeya dianthicola RNS04.9]
MFRHHRNNMIKYHLDITMKRCIVEKTVNTFYFILDASGSRQVTSQCW